MSGGARAAARAAAALLALAAGPAAAGDVEVRAAELVRDGAGTWSASVTLAHGDTGWDHYADAWRVVGTDGRVFGTRTLLHPHETEQPFTRGLSGIAIPPDARRVFVEAHDSVHGWSPQRLELDLSAAVDGRVRAAR